MAAVFFCLGVSCAHASTVTFRGVFKSTVMPWLGDFAIDVGDIEGNGVKSKTDSFIPGGKRLFYLTYRPVRKITKVTVNGVDMDMKDSLTNAPNWTYHPTNAWISFRLVPAGTVTVTYDYSDSLDMLANPYGLLDTHIFKNAGGNNFNIENIHDGMIGRDFDALFDVDNDGDLDAFIIGVGSSTSTVPLSLNDGNGNFSRAPHPNKVPYFQDLGWSFFNDGAYADYDNDGDLDFVAGDFFGDNCLTVARNAGGGMAHFAFSMTPSGNDSFDMTLWNRVKGVDFGDFDLDGDNDIVSVELTETGMLGSGRVRLWKRQGLKGPYLFGSLAKGAVQDGTSIVRVLAATPTTYLDSYGGVAPYQYGSMAVDDDYLYVVSTMTGGGVTTLLKLNKKDMTLAASLSDSSIATQSEKMMQANIAVDDTYVYITSIDPVLGQNKLQKRLKSDFSTLSQNVIGTKYPYTDDNALGVATNTAVISSYGEYSGPRGIVVDDLYVYFWIWDVQTPSQSRIQKRRKDDLSDVVTDFKKVANPTGAGAATLLGGQLSLDNQYLYVVGGTKIQRRNKSDLSLVAEKVTAGATYRSVAAKGSYGSAASQMFVGMGDKNVEIWPASTLVAGSAKVSGPHIIGNGACTGVCGTTYLVYDSSPSGNFELPGISESVWGLSTESLTRYEDVEFVDLDNDGDLDLAMVGPTGFDVYRNNGVNAAGVAQIAKVYHYPVDTDATSLATGDIDKDGYQDVVFVQDISSPRVSVMRNTTGDLSSPAPTFSRVWTDLDEAFDASYKNIDGPKTVRLADMNGDGDLDIVIGVCAGAVIFGKPAAVAGRKITRITSTTEKNGVITTTVSEYSTNADGTLGPLISVHVK